MNYSWKFKDALICLLRINRFRYRGSCAKLRGTKCKCEIAILDVTRERRCANSVHGYALVYHHASWLASISRRHRHNV